MFMLFFFPLHFVISIIFSQCDGLVDKIYYFNDSIIQTNETNAKAYKMHLINNESRESRFLFDAIFRIGSGITNAFGYEDVEDDIDYDAISHVKTCDCGIQTSQDARFYAISRKFNPFTNEGKPLVIHYHVTTMEDCGVSNEEIRIVGGKPTGINQYPWMARIIYDGKFHCGGSLLTKDYVITAAHCVKKLRRSKIRIIFGDHDQHITSESKALQRAVTVIVKHKNFDPDTYNNDIALLRLRRPIVFSKIIRPVCLPRYKYDPAGRIGTVVGWGRTSEGGELPAIVNQVKVPIMSITECRNQKYKSTRITSSMLCAGKPSMDSCQGDSGGPLLLSNGVKYYVVGIVSWGVGCGRDGYPGVYTRVSKFVPWIQSNLENTCLCS